MSRLMSFFLFCSGVEKSVLDKCPTDKNKYAGIGATIFFTGLMAFFASAYALYTVFDSYLAAIAFGIFWGLMIFNLDRYIVMSMKSVGSWWRDLGVALPRFGLAVIIALVIAKPLELKIFEKEINAELIQMEQEVFKSQEDLIKTRYQNEIDSELARIDQLKSEINTKTEQRDALALTAIQEADGTGGSMQKNLGPIYRAKKNDADKAEAELQSLLALNNPLIQKKQENIASYQNSIKEEITNLDRTEYGGLAARMEALSRLGNSSNAIYFAGLFIMFLFIAIETAPIFVKLISHRSPYDYVLHQEEHVFQMANKEKTQILANEIKHKLLFDTATQAHRTNARIMAEKELIDHKVKEKLDDLKSKPYDWTLGMRT